MNLASLQNFRRQAVKTMQGLWPGMVSIAGVDYKAAVKLQPIQLSIPGEGVIEHRGLTADVLKKDMPLEPVIGSTLTHDSRDYIVNSFTGREEFEIHWRIIAVEKDRV